LQDLLNQAGLKPERIRQMTVDERLEKLLTINKEHDRIPSDIALKTCSQVDEGLGY